MRTPRRTPHSLSHTDRALTGGIEPLPAMICEFGLSRTHLPDQRLRQAVHWKVDKPLPRFQPPATGE